MRVCSFCNTPPLPRSIEVGLAGFVPPLNIEKASYAYGEAYLVKIILFIITNWVQKLYSTDICLIHQLDHIKYKNYNGLYTVMVLLGLQKAFDTVDHNKYMLCNKLKPMGVRSTKWFESYLGKSSQLFNIGKTYSDSAAEACVVPLPFKKLDFVEI